MVAKFWSIVVSFSREKSGDGVPNKLSGMFGWKDPDQENGN